MAEVAPRRILLSWSSGKDSAWSLHVLRSDPRFEVCGLLTTVNETHERVAMHGVRERLLEAQARAAGLPLRRVALPHPCSNEEYERRMSAALEPVLADGITGVAFGDLFLEDIRRYRESRSAEVGLEAHFPIWGLDTAELSEAMLDAGLEAVLTCVDPRQVPAELAGRSYDRALLADLPAGADPCGENGEFHTFCHAGPMFDAPVPVVPGERVEREGFVFADLLPG